MGWAWCGPVWQAVSLALRPTDFGGCRRQAYALTADARNTDPACRQAPGHRAVTLRRTTVAAAYRAGGP
ncbi:hypothetical protein ABT075_17575 [Streptomyces sp. NPDC002677]|uniref:hypothetical protein n=1 Tax=Streptomyces sp. NPDC002677 TaxID=3154774 RepID=UPI0033323198